MSNRKQNNGGNLPPLTTFKILINTFLPIRIHHYRKQGGPKAEDYKKLEEIAYRIGSEGTALFWKNADGSSKQLFMDILEAMAIACSVPQDATENQKQMANYRKKIVQEFIDGITSND